MILLIELSSISSYMSDHILHLSVVNIITVIAVNVKRHKEILSSTKTSSCKQDR